MVALFAACAVGQIVVQQKKPKPNVQLQREREDALAAAWHSACERIAKGDDWTQIGDDYELVLGTESPAGPPSDKEQPEIIDPSRTGGVAESNANEAARDRLSAIRAAAERAPTLPPNRPDASPAELTALLQDSRLLHPTMQDTLLIINPLHLHTSQGERRMHWRTLGEFPAHDFTDPAIRAYKRGVEMVPFLIDALDDMTATRCTFIPANQTKTAVMYRRCDLALALLEAITTCRFSNLTQGKPFSDGAVAARKETVAAIRDWVEATREMSQVEAREWLISKVPYEQAKPMLDLLAMDGHTERATELLRGFLMGPEGAPQIKVVRDLAELGDMAGLEALDRVADEKKEITYEGVRLLLAYGGKREIKLLRSLLEYDVEHTAKGAATLSREILMGITAEWRGRPAVIPILAVLLDPDDVAVIGTAIPAELKLSQSATRSDLATLLIQELTKQNFRFDPTSDREFRRAAILRAKAWWESEGVGVYGLESADLQQRGRIR